MTLIRKLGRHRGRHGEEGHGPSGRRGRGARGGGPAGGALPPRRISSSAAGARQGHHELHRRSRAGAPGDPAPARVDRRGPCSFPMATRPWRSTGSPPEHNEEAARTPAAEYEKQGRAEDEEQGGGARGAPWLVGRERGAHVDKV
jgi:hypothetical protein